MLGAVRVTALLLLLLGPYTAPGAATVPPRVDLRPRASALLAERVLDLALPDRNTLLVLSPDALTLYRLDGTRLRLLDRESLPPAQPVRAPAGMLLLADDGSSCWALVTGRRVALLFDVGKEGLERLGDAEALPWPGSPSGVRVSPGTNHLRVTRPGLPGALLRLLPGNPSVAVSTSGQLLVGGLDTSLRTGPAVAHLFPGLLAASPASPPGAQDEILILALGDGPPEVTERLPVEGAVRALGARTSGRDLLLGAALELPGGSFRILLLQAAQGAP
jgi:hypothetical protein